MVSSRRAPALKRPLRGSRPAPKRASRAAAALDDEVESVSEGSDREEAPLSAAAEAAKQAEEEEEAETADERRVRLAKQMLTQMDQAARGRREPSRGDVVAAELEDEALRRDGKFVRRLATKLQQAGPPAEARLLRGIRLSPTCVSVAPDEAWAYCGCKDGSIAGWELRGGSSSSSRLRLAADRSELEQGATPRGHARDVLAVVAAHDGRSLISAGRDGRVLIWDRRTSRVVKALSGHRRGVTALAQRRDASSAELYSGSADRCIRAWDVAQRAFVETLFGHQEGVTALDAIGEQLLVSASEDRTLRLWKVAEETQLLFGGGGAPIDAVSMLTPSVFASGAQDGTIALWSSLRKKALATVPRAHGVGGPSNGDGSPCWISALTAPVYSDVLLSGSCDGFVRFWRADDEARCLEPIGQTPLNGFVNGMAIAPSGKFVAAAVGQEHRLGRWFRMSEARNGLAILLLDKCMHMAPKLLSTLAIEKAKQTIPAPWEEAAEAALVSESEESAG